MIGALVWFGRSATLPQLVVLIAWASVVGSAFQLGVQVPSVVRLSGSLRRGVRFDHPAVRRVFRNFVPAFTSRGVVQLSSYVDLILAIMCG